MKREKVQQLQVITKFALWGAIGFSIGGAIGGFLLYLEEPISGFPVFGAIDGISLGFTLEGWRKAGILALACAIGLSIGFMVAFFIVLAVWGPGACYRFYAFQTRQFWGLP